MLLQNNDRLFWIVFIFSFVFFILSVISLLGYKNISCGSLFLLSSLWFLSFILIFIIHYTALLYNTHCRHILFLIYLINLLFLTIWSMQLTQLTNANISIIIILITGIAIIYFTKPQFYFLGLIYLFIWLTIFFILNH